MKKTYKPSLICIVQVGQELPIAESNAILGDSIDFDPTTMSGGDGSDAVKSHSYSVWEDDWSE